LSNARWWVEVRLMSADAVGTASVEPRVESRVPKGKRGDCRGRGTSEVVLEASA
jgi:hypothetical protein